MVTAIPICVIFIIYIYGVSTSDCVHWGNKFDVPLDSNNVALNCLSPSGKPVCCEAIDETSQYGINSRGVGNEFASVSNSIMEIADSCDITKEYFSSPQEIRDLDYSLRLQTIQDFDERFVKLLDYITSTEVVANSTAWLSRISYHMSNPQLYVVNSNTQHHKDDIEYLSYFLVTKTCQKSGTLSWMEWIEPLTITARHPFALGRCRPLSSYYKMKNDNSNTDSPAHGSRRKGLSVSRSNVDYVLLQSGANFHQHNYNTNGQYQNVATTTIKRGRTFNNFNSTSYSSNYHPLKKIVNKGIQPPKFYMLDSGTSTFDSSLFWFTCGYSQGKLSFNQVFAWELTLLEPNDYWSRVPAKWIPHWHFYNIPISSDEKAHNSPVKHIKTIATPQDFVAFKLDIDTSSVEMPIALELLKDEVFQSLVDEFFFELHFQCEVMALGKYGGCGWGGKVPAESHGLTLDRPHVLKFFMELRQSGIRAHIWP